MKMSIKGLLSLGALLAVAAGSAQAEDIDVFLSKASGIVATRPNILFLVDNTSNWNSAAQAWPDNGGVQGKAELKAIGHIVENKGAGRNIGLAAYTTTGTGGGYIRYAVRDMDDANNRNAMIGVLNYMKDSNFNKEQVTSSANNPYETGAMFEALRYFTGKSVFRGAQAGKSDPSYNVDIDQNEGSGSGATAFNQPTVPRTSGFAYSNSTYLGPPVPTQGCSSNILIMVVNNNDGKLQVGDRSYTVGGQTFDAGPAMEQIPGVTDVSWTDEWARYLRQSGITVYILDAFNKKQNKSQSAILERAADKGGGKYFQVGSEAALIEAISQIFAEIDAKDSTFASAALPVSSSNRSQYLNQVFIGMFRPDPHADPLWLGNLKQYHLELTKTGDVQLTDMVGANAINSQTGFVHECAVSNWTTHSGSFWNDVKNLSIDESACKAFPTWNGSTGSANSDLPDGPTVAKGGVAQMIRKGNSTTSTSNPGAWNTSFRNILTYSATAPDQLTSIMSTVPSGWTQELRDWISGRNDENKSDYYSSGSDRIRASTHGDVIHSKPLPVNYGSITDTTPNVTVYYGANDGFLRAVDAATGRERWAYIETGTGTDDRALYVSKYKRLKDNSPAVRFPGYDDTPSPQPKDYFFDGSIGLYQTLNNSKVFIFPSLRRGGRLLYGFDVTTPDVPRLAWRIGCPNPIGASNQDDGCTTGFAGLGQTWSQPTVAKVKSLGDDPIIIVGGGYDPCEDVDSATRSCGTAKGRAIYFINALTGAKIAVPSAFENLNGSVAADIALADRNGDGYVDFAYAVTTSGDIYRINFSNGNYEALTPAEWGIRRVAHTSGSGRKFLNAPALMPAGTKMYVALGSGDRERPLKANYPYRDLVVNRFYVFVDDVAQPQESPTSISLDDTTYMQNFTAETSCTTAGVDPGSSWRGWFMNLSGRGEQTVTSAVAAAGMVTFSTNRPYEGETNICSANANLGEARGYWLNIVNGSGAIGAGASTCGGDRFGVFTQGGLVPSPTLASVKIGDKIQTVVLGAIQRSGGASSGIAPQAIKPAIKAKRKVIYWRSKKND